jgi:hypothetical protein
MQSCASEADPAEAAADEDVSNLPSAANGGSEQVMEQATESFTPLSLLDKASELAIAHCFVWSVSSVLTFTNVINPYGIDG